MDRTSRKLPLALLIAIAGLALGNDCGGDLTYGLGTPDFRFESPLHTQLSLTGPMAFSLRVPDDSIPSSLEVLLDGEPVDVSGPVTPGALLDGSLGDVPTGKHVLEATLDVRLLVFFFVNRRVLTTFETAALEDPDRCEILNNAECLLPYPSSRFLVEDPTTPTGVRLNAPDGLFPDLIGPPVDPAPYDELDGNSPTAQLLMHFPGGVDLDRPDIARLLDPPPSPVSPPYVDLRTVDDTSRDAESKTVLIDAETGERILHFVELDARTDDPARQTLILRPGHALTPARRYIAAVRGLQHADGSEIHPEAPFAVLRDGRPTDIAALEARRDHYEDNVFPQLAAAGIDRENLQLAYDFVVQSDAGLTSQVLDMRDQVYAWFDEQLAQENQTFTVEEMETFDCTDAGQTTWRIVKGTYLAPLFLTEDLEAEPNSVGFLNVDEDGNPVQNGLTNPPFTISIPCAALLEEPPVLHPLVLGHGLFGTGEGLVEGFADGFAGAYIAGGTDWRGLSARDLLWVGLQIIGAPAVGGHKFNNFPALPDRLKQGQIQTQLLARMLKVGAFNADPAFQLDGDGTGVFPGEETEMFYFGISLGGIMGTWFAALTEDVERFNVDVPAINFSFLLQRSTQFGNCGGFPPCFEDLLAGVGLSDPMQVLLGLQVQHELWVRGEPAGYVHRLRDEVASGDKKLLMTVAFLDKQVSNQVQEVMARSLGLPQLIGSLHQEMVDIPDVAGPVDSAMVIYDTGSFDIFDPAQTDPALDPPLFPPLANVVASTRCDPHARRLGIPASVEQLETFLQPGGQIQNFCNGICDAGEAFEKPGGTDEVCDPLP